MPKLSQFGPNHRAPKSKCPNIQNMIKSSKKSRLSESQEQQQYKLLLLGPLNKARGQKNVKYLWLFSEKKSLVGHSWFDSIWSQGNLESETRIPNK